MENGKTAETTALVDSGATICCINLHMAQQMKWPMEKLRWPMQARNTGETNNLGGMIHHQMKLHLRIDGKTTEQNFFIVNLGWKNNNILGYPWLAKDNPNINWATGELRLMGIPISWHDEPEVVEQQYLLCYLGALVQHNLELAARVHAQQRNRAMLRRILGERHLHIWKLTLSMALAQAMEKVETKLPP